MSDLYAWVPWFRELARKIAQRRPEYLARQARKIPWNVAGEAALVRHGDAYVDPFSFFRFLASKNEAPHWERVHPAISEQFGLTARSGHTFDAGFYFPAAKQQLLFHNAGVGDPDLFWRLFRAAVQGPHNVNGADFKAALTIPGVAIPKLTQTLFLINPQAFLPFDDQSLCPLRRELYGVNDWESYLRELDTLRNMFPGCEAYEIQHFAYAVFGRKELDITGGRVWRSSTSVGEGESDGWHDFRQNGWIHYRKPPYALRRPVPGDLVLVHTGLTEGRGIGVVHRNDHKGFRESEQRLHVVWLNTKRATVTESDGWLSGERFSGANKTLDTFRSIPAYAPTFEVLHRLGWEAEDSGVKPTPKRELVPPPGLAFMSDLESLADETLISEDELREITKLLDDKGQVIFQGPPGTGKTYLARKLATFLGGSSERVRLVQFHPSYAYEDFVQGFRPTLRDGHAGFKLRNGPLVRMAKRAEREPDAKHFLIIDEINRGNLSKIFGELYFLLEYRNETMRLQYSDKAFSLPGNLYFIGTMNTADRSIALVDLALRRRFYFKEFHPDKPPINELLRKWLKEHKLEEFLDLERVLQEANKELADRHASIGPTYFMPKDRKLDDKRVRRIWEHNVMPYIEERLFDQEDRLKEFNLDRLLKRAKGHPPPADEAQEDVSEVGESNNEGD